MPAIPSSGTVTVGNAGQTFVDARGATRAVSLRVGGSVTTAQAEAVFDARGNMSNAAVEEQRIGTTESISRSALTAFDEAESSVDTVLVCVFENAGGERVSDTIPAPDHTVLISPTRDQIDPSQAQAAAYITAMQTLLAAANGGTWTLARSYVTGFKGRGSRPRALPPTIAEPDGVGDLPAQGPALEP